MTHAVPPYAPSDDPDDDGAPDGWPGHLCPDVIEVDNPVVATLYGPDGDVLIELRERPVIGFGYQRGEP